MPVPQSFNKILLTTSNTAENNIMLTESGAMLHVNGVPVITSGDFFAIKTVTGSTYTQEPNFTHFHYTSAGNVTIDLIHPTGATYINRHKKLSNAGNVTLDPPEGVTIDGSETFVLNTQYESIALYTDGSNYFIQ